MLGQPPSTALLLIRRPIVSVPCLFKSRDLGLNSRINSLKHFLQKRLSVVTARSPTHQQHCPSRRGSGSSMPTSHYPIANTPVNPPPYLLILTILGCPFSRLFDHCLDFSSIKPFAVRKIDRFNILSPYNKSNLRISLLGIN